MKKVLKKRSKQNRVRVLNSKRMTKMLKIRRRNHLLILK